MVLAGRVPVSMQECALGVDAAQQWRHLPAMRFIRQARLFFATNEANPLDWVGQAHNQLLGAMLASKPVDREDHGGIVKLLVSNLRGGAVEVLPNGKPSEASIRFIESYGPKLLGRLSKGKAGLLRNVEASRLSGEAKEGMAWLYETVTGFDPSLQSLLDQAERLRSWEARVVEHPSFSEHEQTILLSCASVARHSAKFWIDRHIESVLGGANDGSGVQGKSKRCCNKKKQAELDALIERDVDGAYNGAFNSTATNPQDVAEDAANGATLASY
jgi:hypothetical protein